MGLSLKGESRIHNEKGNMVSVASMLNAVPAFVTVVTKSALNYFSKAPMISYQAWREFDRPLTPEVGLVEFGSGNATPWFATEATYMISAEDNRDSYKRVQPLIATLKLENNRHKLRSETDYADLSDVKDA